MRYLLDTHFVIWWLAGSPRLTSTARQKIIDNDCAVSAASLIEMQMKTATGKLAPPRGASAAKQLASEGFTVLSLTPEHIEESARFEQAHADFYDRLMLATAAVEGRVLLTRDAALLDLAKKAGLSFVTEG